ncbi:MAG: hypothetical protein JNL32_00395 [Candidatus Kapabacteria bacterium]|nr:hypothetical protein [Candidatus Kapabacteria bacterium]
MKPFAVFLAIVSIMQTTVAQTGIPTVFPFSGSSQSIEQLRKTLTLPDGKKLVVLYITPASSHCGDDRIAGVGKLLAQQGDIETIGIIRAPKYYAGLDYITKSSFPFRCLLDTSDFYFGDVGLKSHFTFITSWDNGSRLLYSTSIPGRSTNNDIVAAILKTNEPLVADNGNAHQARTPVQFISAEWKKPTMTVFSPLQESSSVPLGAMNRMSFNPRRTKVAVYDRSIDKVRIFETATGKFLYSVTLDLASRKSLSPGIDDKTFLTLEEKLAMPRYTHSPCFISDDTLIICTLLPLVQRDADREGKSALTVVPRQVIVAGYAGRDSFITTSVASLQHNEGDADRFNTTFLSYPVADTRNGTIAARTTSRMGNNAPQFSTINYYTGKVTLRNSNAAQQAGINTLGEKPVTFSASTGYITLEDMYTKPYLLCANGKSIPVKTYCRTAALQNKYGATSKPDINSREFRSTAGASVNALWSNDSVVFIHWMIDIKNAGSATTSMSYNRILLLLVICFRNTMFLRICRRTMS